MTLFKKETQAQVFSCEFCEIFKNTFFYRKPPVAASDCLCFPENEKVSLKERHADCLLNVYKTNSKIAYCAMLKC